MTIDKSQVLEILQKSQDKFNDPAEFTKIYNSIVALPEHLTATWLQEDDMIICSNCCGRINKEQYTYYSSRYCPCCGAYMKKHNDYLTLV